MPDIHKRRISNHRVYFDYQAILRPNRCLQRRTTNRKSVSDPRCLRGVAASREEILMRLVKLRAPGGLENLKLVEEDHPETKAA